MAFAANSVLCRMALKQTAIDAASFSTIRMLSGATILSLIYRTACRRQTAQTLGNWFSAVMLFTYMVTFSFAYISLSTGTGALVLFAMVQATMILWALWSGERPRLLEWSGFLLALTGLVYLLFPGLTAPSPAGALLMAIAGMSWGVYSLRGRAALDPLAETTGNFVRATPFVLIVSLMTLQHNYLSAKGILFAVISGALASGVGYAVWYIALKTLTATRAAIVQLSVPVLAAMGGVMFLEEALSIRLVLSSILILGGVSLATLGHKQLPQEI